MTVTANEVFEIAMDLIDERQDTGAISDSNTKSYKVKTPGILTLLQAELIKQGDLYKTHEISNTPIKNMYGLISGFDIEEFTGDEITHEVEGSCKAYYFEVDGECTVYVDDYTDKWNTLATITVSDISDFEAYKGVVTPTAGATKSRLRFTGNYYYRITNKALFEQPFKDATKVPDYRPWVKKTMPSDFKRVDQIIREEPQRQYKKDSHYKWEGRKDLYINYYFEGNIRVVYRPIPDAITAITDTLELDDVTCRTILPYGLAAHLMLTENPDIASYFNSRFEELKAFASIKPPASADRIIDVYGIFHGGD